MIYISKYNKNIWPSFLWPEENELFSSWICRFSNNNEIRSESIIKNYFDNSINLWNRDIDMFAPKIIINYLEQHTPLKLNEIENLFLKSYEGIVFEKANPFGFTENVLKLGVNHRKRKSFGIVFCPSCLNEDIAYFRKEWRLSFSIFCEKCNCKLLEKCPSCNNPVSFHRNNINLLNNSTSSCLPLNICECKYNLANAYIDNNISSEEIEFQSYMNKTLTNGFNDHSNYSFLFYKGLSLMTYNIMRNNKKNKFHKYLKKEFKIEYELNSKHFFDWNLDERRKGFLIMYYLMSDFPNRLNKIFNDLKINRSDFYYLPYFIEKVIINK